MKRRVKALKNVLHEYVKVESAFYKELYDLEKKYMGRYDVLLDKVEAAVLFNIRTVISVLILYLGRLSQTMKRRLGIIVKRSN